MKNISQLCLFLCILIGTKIATIKTKEFPDFMHFQFPEINMIETPDSGVFVDINPNTFFFDRVNFLGDFNTIKMDTNEVQNLSHTLVVDQPLARLKVTVTFNVSRNFVASNGSYKNFQIAFGPNKKIIGNANWHLNSSKSWILGYYNIKFHGWVYNVKPGQYDIKILYSGDGNNPQPYIGTNNGGFTSFEFEGEVLGNESINNTLLPLEQAREKKYARGTATADDIIYYMYINGLMHDLSKVVTDGTLSNLSYKKVFEVPVEEGAYLDFYIKNNYGPGDFMANIGYYDRYGVFQVTNTNTSTWNCGSTPKSKTKSYAISVPLTEHSKYRPMDFANASFIYFTSGYGQLTYSYCGTKIPYSKSFQAKLYATPIGTAGKLTKLKIGSSSWTLNQSWNEIYSKTSTKLVSGVKVNF